MTTVHLPKSAAYVVVGMGMHGMSTAWHLAMELERSGKGKGSDVLLIDKDSSAGLSLQPRDPRFHGPDRIDPLLLEKLELIWVLRGEHLRIPA